MSVSLLEVLENAGYDIKNNLDDARWLLAQRDEFEEICDMAELLESSHDEYNDFVEMQEELGNFDTPSWEEWREENGNK
jgi:hypothetical protein